MVGKGQIDGQELGKELKKCLTDSFNIEKIASWAENLYKDPRRFSPEVNDILDTFSMMSLAPEFYYSEKELWLLADFMENNIDRPLEIKIEEEHLSSGFRTTFTYDAVNRLIKRTDTGV